MAQFVTSDGARPTLRRKDPPRPIITISPQDERLWRYTVRFAAFGPVAISGAGFATIQAAANEAAMRAAAWEG